MNKTRAAGALTIIISLLLLTIYNYIMFFTENYLILIKITLALEIVAISIFGIWIGYTLITAPPPKPIEEIEKEIEEELQKLQMDNQEE